MKKSLKGIFVKHYKHTMNSKLEVMPVPEKAYISMSQHMGPPCEVKVSVNDIVKVGQVIGDSTAFLSAPVHSSVSGKVSAITEMITPMGSTVKVVVVSTDGEQTLSEDIKKPECKTHEDFIKIVKDSGLVGLGGAGFPTHIKLNPKNLNEVDTLVINAAECEPFITSDYHTMMNDTDDIIAGAESIMKYLKLKKCIIGIEDNKPKAIEKISELIKNKDGYSVVTLKSKYPQGAEKVLIYETTGKVVGEGKLPADVGVIVCNIATVAFISEYMRTGIPLISKKITIDGGAIKEKKNIKVLIGTRICDIVDYCKGYEKEVKKILMGGPMMGIAVYNNEYPLLKNNNALLFFDEEQVVDEQESPCIRCGRCVRACPLNLMPAAIDKSFLAGDTDELLKLKVNLCMECGCCSYVCPAKRYLVQSNRMAKKLLRENKK